MEESVARLDIITQNVDGLHQLAGSSDVIEIHGNIHRSRCIYDGKTFGDDVFSDDVVRVDVVRVDVVRDDVVRDDVVRDDAVQSDGIPQCPECGNLLRPDVVWFGESLPATAYSIAMDAAQSCDMFFSIGTSALVQPAASLALEARRYKSIIVEINLEDTPLSTMADFSLLGPSGSVLPSLVEAAYPL
jgi:NAD-dependent deacetylase